MELKETLAQSGIRMTLQRRLIADRIDRETQPFSAEDLFEKGLRKKHLDLVTIYRTLTLFYEMGFLQKSEFGERKSRYWKATSKSHTHTLFCRDCQKVQTLNDCKLNDQHQHLLKLGFTDLVHKVEFIGRCPECSTL